MADSNKGTSVEIRVLFFASAREAVGGTAEIKLNLATEQAKTSGVRQRLAEEYPKLADMVLDEDSITLALNEEYVGVGENIPLKTGDTVALIPPISGG